MILLTKLLLAHLSGDFLLQPDRWVKDKQLKKHHSPKLYLHVLVHAALTMLLVWDLTFWIPVVVIVFTHYCIDLLKVHIEKPNNKTFLFVTDQFLHIGIIVALWYVWENPVIHLENFPSEQLLIIITAAIFLTNPTSVIIKNFIAQWTPETLYTVASSLPDAGKIIGYLERLLVLTFILNHHWEAVGFLLAAKSVFRFGNLKESHDRKLTEYVLIGTLLSFGIALAVSLATAALLRV